MIISDLLFDLSTDILETNLRVLYNYFDDLMKLFSVSS